MAEQHPQVPPRFCFDRLGAAVKEMKAKIVMELGTNYGFSTREFSKALRETGGRLYSVDINPPIDNWPQKINFPVDNVTFVQHDSLTVDISTMKEPLDLLFVDDRHTYRHLLQILRRYAPLVREGGRIYVDDPTHCDGVMQPEMNCGASVLWAAALWCRENQLQMHLYTDDGYGLLEIVLPKKIGPVTALDARIFGITGVATVLNGLQYHKDLDA